MYADIPKAEACKQDKLHYNANELWQQISTRKVHVEMCNALAEDSVELSLHDCLQTDATYLALQVVDGWVITQGVARAVFAFMVCM